MPTVVSLVVLIVAAAVTAGSGVGARGTGAPAAGAPLGTVGAALPTATPAVGAVATTGTATAPVGEPVRPEVHTVALPTGRSGDGPSLPARGVHPFSLVGVTWTDSGARLDSRVQIRARSAVGHRWGPWTDLPTSDDASEADPSGRGGTAGVWVGGSDGVQWRVAGVLTAALPQGLRLDLVDPGRPDPAPRPRTAPAAFTVPAGPTTGPTTGTTTGTTTGSSPAASTVVPSQPPAPTPPATPTATATELPTGRATGLPGPALAAATPIPAAAGAPPPVISRAGWGADETLRRSAPQYSGAAKVMFVHHTVSSNTYSCNESAAVIRSLYAYHTLSRGWNDLGYNFLVDRCGTLFEGRYGGLDRPVVGAHTLGFNTATAGIAVIGTFSSAPAAPEVLATVAAVAAWKLGLAGISPTDTSTLEAGTTGGRFTAGRTYSFPAISGHQDGYATACPGAALYRQLPLLRSLAATTAGAPGPRLTITGAAAAGGRYVTAGRIGVSWTPASPAADVTGYSVLVDDSTVATTDPAARGTTLTLPPGTHRITVRAAFRAPPQTLPTSASPDGPTTATGSPVTTDGSPPPTTGSPPGTPGDVPADRTSLPVTVVVDVRAPIFTSPPAVGLRSGTVNATGIPVLVRWQVRDDVQLAAVTTTGPAAARLGIASTSWATIAGPGARRYGLTATDAAGNATSAAATARATLIPETAATRSGRWSRTVSGSHGGGSALASGTKNSSLAWTFTGRSVALVATRTKWSGQVRVYLDGAGVATIDLRTSSTSYRQAVWTRNGLPAGRHTARIVVLGTPKRPTVVVDGIVTLS